MVDCTQSNKSSNVIMTKELVKDINCEVIKSVSEVESITILFIGQESLQ